MAKKAKAVFHNGTSLEFAVPDDVEAAIERGAPYYDEELTAIWLSILESNKTLPAHLAPDEILSVEFH